MQVAEYPCDQGRPGVPEHGSRLAARTREPYTAGNWHQMLPDLSHPPGSWKHLFV